MTRRFALLLTFAMIFTLVSVVGVSAANDVNLASGKPYTASTPYTDRIYPNDYQLIDGKELTDGVKGTTDYGTEWHGFYNQNSYFVKVDLGMKYPGIKKITMQVADNSPASVVKPKTVEYFISNDNKNFTSVGTATATKTGTVSATSLYDYTLVLSPTVTARFVRVVITKDTGMFVFASELEVFNSGEAGTASAPGEVYPDPGEITEPVLDYNKILPKAEAGIIIKDNYIYGIQPKTYYTYAMSQFLNPTGLVLKDKDGKAKTSGYIATGDKMELVVNNQIVDTKTIVIDGDLNGDGQISSIDCMRYKKAYIGNYTLTGEYLEAARIQSAKFSTLDYLRMKKQVLGNYNIYMNKYADAALVYPMTITKSSESLYTFDTKYNGKSLSLNFHRNNEPNWTTWNIGTLSYGGSLLAGVGTDWEYVYRVSDKKLSSTESYPFCGGNHKNEILKEMKIYDTATKEELNLTIGEPVPVNGIKIVEKTQILFDKTNTPWCDVVRTYYFAGNKIELLVDYKIIADCYFALSYTCMFPVYRDYATHALFYNNNGTTTAINAATKAEFPTKYPSGSGPYLGQLPATKVKIWGDKNPEYSFEIQVYNEKDSCGNFKHPQKTFFWEMGVNAPKLYFSKFNTGDEGKVGMTWSTKSTWAFYVNPTN